MRKLSCNQPWFVENGDSANTHKNQGNQIPSDSKGPCTVARNRGQEHTQSDHRRISNGPETRLLNPRTNTLTRANLERARAIEQMGMLPEIFPFLRIEIFAAMCIVT